MLRERLSMAFFRRMGLPAPREAHARLFVNDSFVGVYAVVETIDKGFLGRSFGADSTGAPRTTAICSSTTTSSEYRFEYPGSNLDDYKIFDPEDPREGRGRATVGTDRGHGPGGERDARTRTSTARCRLPRSRRSSARHLALENFLAEDDGILGYAGMNNFYMYRFEDSKRSQLLAWDKDNTFRSVDFDIMNRVGDNVLARRTLALPQYKNNYLNTLLDAAASAMEPDPRRRRPTRRATR